ncbi:hypothetical protein [Devosia sediminis]|uniref:Uncharacterized protein n=1 Tax=Devosia sediminis TaxID=2798801 RepID=A0A934MMG0_9HYPH|nr:hypothetical protein [Devosia sediminis]MBJ3785671.1 hypothetical protein [Devosia sediminis]
MVWELVAIWAIVGATFWWFLRDERRRLGLDRLAEQARVFATGPQWRHGAPPLRREPSEPASRDLTDVQRRFLEELRRQRQR